MDARGAPTTVIAFGGNAFVPRGARGTYEEQRAHAGEMAAVVGDVLAGGHRVVVAHGNGPQAGNLALQQEQATEGVVPQPLHALVAMTQGQLGSMIALALRGLVPRSTSVVVALTHVRVDREDPAFQSPTKPIGPFYEPDEGRRLADERGWDVVMVEDGLYRRVVASPAPQEVVELRSIAELVDGGAVVVAVGGGGIPVVASPEGGFTPVDAVIDKDLAAERLGSALGASRLVLVTGVPEVHLDYGTGRQRPVRELTAAEAMEHHAAGQFPAGSMGPKIEAAVEFLKNGGELAVITSPEHAAAALAGEHGTRIVPR